MRVKPISTIPYTNIDWWTDAKYIEFCVSSFDPEHFSLRVHRRREDGGYSRMSEQLPLHRPVDLIILLVYSLKALKNKQFHFTIPAGKFGRHYNDEPSEEIAFSFSPQLIDKALENYNTMFKKDAPLTFYDFLKEKLKSLSTVLNEELENI